MSGQLRAAGFFAKLRRELGLIGQPLPNAAGGQQQEDKVLLSLDDPVIDGIKCHLVISSRIGLEPLSQKFGRIAFFVKRRMAIKLAALLSSSAQLADTDWSNDIAHLMLTERRNANKCQLVVIPMGQVQTALRSLFRRIRKWRSVHFQRQNDHADDVQPVWDALSSHLLDAILSECSRDEEETIDVQRFSCVLRPDDRDKFAEVVRLFSPTLRICNVIDKHDDDDDQQPQQQPLAPFLLEGLAVQALYSCRKLRQLVLAGACPWHFPADFLSRILALLPRLNILCLGHQIGSALTVNGQIVRPFPSATTTLLSICEDWLPLVIGLLQLQPAVFSDRFQCLKLVTDSDNEWLGDVERIVAQMRRPAFVQLHFLYRTISWRALWQDYLPMVYRTGARVRQALCDELPVITAEAFAAGLATMPAIVQAALTTVPDLATAAAVSVDDDCYRELEFGFANGARLILKSSSW